MEDLELLEQKAVDAAVNFQWEEAIKLNKRILRKDRKNLPALLRLGFAFLQLKKLLEAKKIYTKILKIQPVNQIAKENLEKIKILRSYNLRRLKQAPINFNPDLFLEIAGQTKTAKLVNLGQKNILALLSIGQEVVLKPKKRKVEIRTKEGDYIGSLPDDLSRRLMLFIRAKSTYSAYIKEASLSHVVVFIKEETKGARVANFVSFPVDLSKNINKIGEEVDKSNGTVYEREVDEGDASELDLEKIAEALATEEKETLPYQNPETEEETEE